MKTRTRKLNRVTKEKISEIENKLWRLYSITNNGYNGGRVYACREVGLNNDHSFVLEKNGLIKVYGSKKNRKTRWNTIPPNAQMARELIVKSRAYNRDRKAILKQRKADKKLTLGTTKDEFYKMIDKVNNAKKTKPLSQQADIFNPIKDPVTIKRDESDRVEFTPPKSESILMSEKTTIPDITVTKTKTKTIKILGICVYKNVIIKTKPLKS